MNPSRLEFIKNFKNLKVDIDTISKVLIKHSLIESCRRSNGQVFMHLKTGELFIMWPISWVSKFTSMKKFPVYKIQYNIEGDDGHVGFIRGDPFLYGFEYLGEF